MSLQAASTINLTRNRVVKYIDANGKSYNAQVRAITGAGTTLTLWVPSLHIQLTGVAKATVSDGAGFHYRSTV